jgi:hypothetical protein
MGRASIIAQTCAVSADAWLPEFIFAPIAGPA